MKTLGISDIEKLARLAQLKIEATEIPIYLNSLSNIIDMISTMQTVDTDTIERFDNPLNISQRLRPDTITEPNQRELFQSLTPHTTAGLYLVPKVLIV